MLLLLVAAFWPDAITMVAVAVVWLMFVGFFMTVKLALVEGEISLVAKKLFSLFDSDECRRAGMYCRSLFGECA